ncbi:hypothetical protein MRX96_040548 [Rhipicephalus microplus]
MRRVYPTKPAMITSTRSLPSVTQGDESSAHQFRAKHRTAATSSTHTTRTSGGQGTPAADDGRGSLGDLLLARTALHGGELLEAATTKEPRKQQQPLPPPRLVPAPGLARRAERRRRRLRSPFASPNTLRAFVRPIIPFLLLLLYVSARGDSIQPSRIPQTFRLIHPPPRIADGARLRKATRLSFDAKPGRRMLTPAIAARRSCVLALDTPLPTTTGFVGRRRRRPCVQPTVK